MKQIRFSKWLVKPKFALVRNDLALKFVQQIVFVLLFSYSAFGQDLLWLKQMAGSSPNDSSPSDVVVDHLGNVYVVGNFRGTINFGGSVATALGRDIFFAKYNPSGTLLWIKRVGATNGFCSPTGASLYKDASNNVFLYISGYFNSINGAILTINFNPEGTAQNLTMNDVQGDAFIAKYNSSGVCQWARRVTNTGGDYTSGGKVATDDSGNAYIASTVPESGGFLRKYSSAGDHLWSNTIGDNATDVAFRSPNIYVCGSGLASSRPIAWYNSSGGVVNLTLKKATSFINNASQNNNHYHLI